MAPPPPPSASPSCQTLRCPPARALRPTLISAAHAQRRACGSLAVTEGEPRHLSLHLRMPATLHSLGFPRAGGELDPGRAPAPPRPPRLTLQGAWFLTSASRHSMPGVMLPCQKRLLLHIRVSSTRTSSSRSALASWPPRCVSPQPATLHRAPTATAWCPRGKARARMVLLRLTFPSSCRRQEGPVGGAPGRAAWARGHCSRPPPPAPEAAPGRSPVGGPACTWGAVWPPWLGS